MRERVYRAIGRACALEHRLSCTPCPRDGGPRDVFCWNNKNARPTHTLESDEIVSLNRQHAFLGSAHATFGTSFCQRTDSNYDNRVADECSLICIIGAPRDPISLDERPDRVRKQILHALCASSDSRSTQRHLTDEARFIVAAESTSHRYELLYL